MMRELLLNVQILSQGDPLKLSCRPMKIEMSFFRVNDFASQFSMPGHEDH